MAPIRTCIGCRKAGPADGLVRVVLEHGGTVAVGRALPGRGAWLCRDSPACLHQAVRRGAFSRALRGEVGKAQLDQLVLTLGPRDGASGKDMETGSGEPAP